MVKNGVFVHKPKNAILGGSEQKSKKVQFWSKTRFIYQTPSRMNRYFLGVFFGSKILYEVYVEEKSMFLKWLN